MARPPARAFLVVLVFLFSGTVVANPVAPPVVQMVEFGPPGEVSLWFGVVYMVNMQMSFLSPPFGYDVLGTEFSQITAPDATAADPLVLTFTVDATVWDGIPLGSLNMSERQ